jgi:hypothetical protein
MDATTFPIPLTYHVIFCAAACIFFIVQYVRTKKSYQLLLAIGIPASLCIYINPENSSLFYSVGVFEAVLLVGAIIFAFIERTRRKQEIEDTTPLPEEKTSAVSSAEKSDDKISDGEQK